MKKSGLLVAILFLVVGCNKEPLADYRDYYTGTYVCDKSGYDLVNGDSTYNYYFDTVLPISVTKVNDSLIQILDATLKVDINGEFGGGLYPDPLYHSFQGYFVNDSIYFNTYQGGMGCFISFEYKGKKF